MRNRGLKMLTLRKWLNRDKVGRKRMNAIYKGEDKPTYHEALREFGYSYNAS